MWRVEGKQEHASEASSFPQPVKHVHLMLLWKGRLHPPAPPFDGGDGFATLSRPDPSGLVLPPIRKGRVGMGRANDLPVTKLIRGEHSGPSCP